jgi:hypothetical protein
VRPKWSFGKPCSLKQPRQVPAHPTLKSLGLKASLRGIRGVADGADAGRQLVLMRQR